MLRASGDAGVELWELGTRVDLVPLGRILSTLFSVRSQELQKVLSHDHEELQKHKRSAKNLVGRAAASLLDRVMDAIKKGASLENICVPILEHVVKSKDHKNRKQATCLFHWLFQHKEVDTALAKSLLLIIRGSQYEKRVKLGWCIAVRDLVQSTLDFEKIHSRVEMGGFPHQALTTIADSVSKLVQIVCNESVQDGKECSPTRLTAMAVDCILVITRALCKLDKSLKTNAHRDDNNLLQRSDFGDLASKSFDAELTWGSRESSQVIDIETSCIRIGLDGLGSHKQISLWSMLDDLIVLISELYKWNYKKRPLHAKGLEQVLKQLEVLTDFRNALQSQENYHDPSVGEEVLKVSWKEYSILMIIEDELPLSLFETLLQKYVDALQEPMYEGHLVQEDQSQLQDNSKTEQIKGYGLGCLALLLGRFSGHQLETILNKFEPHLLQILLQQLRGKDNHMVHLVVVILKEIIFRTRSSQQSDIKPSRMSKMETVAPLLLDLLDKHDSTSRAVVTLIAEYFSTNTDSSYFERLFSLLDSGDTMQRKNALDVLLELFVISPGLVDEPESVFCQKITKLLIARLGDEELTNRIQASALFSKLDPAYVLPALLQSMLSLDGRIRSAANSATLAVLQGSQDQCRVICTLLDCMRGLQNIIHVPNHPGQIGSDDSLSIGLRHSKGSSAVDVEKIMHVISKWASSVQDWNSIIHSVLDKMFREPSNPIIPKFLSKISSHLADNTHVVYEIIYQVLKEQPYTLDDYAGYEGACDTWKSVDGTLKVDLFERLSPLLVLKVLPLRAYNNLQCQALYGSNAIDSVLARSPSISSMLVGRMCALLEYEDVRKLSAELVGRLIPQVMLQQVVPQLKNAISNFDTLRTKACAFAICNSLMLREEIVKHPLMISIQQLLCSILLWTNVNNSEEVEKTQHGCIDCLAMMIRAELVIATGRGNVLPGMTVQKSTLLIEEMDSSTSEDLKHRVDSDISILYMVLNCFLKCNDKVFSHGASTLSSSQMDLSWTSQYYTAQQKSEGADILLQENKLEVDDWNKYRSLQGLDDNIIDTNNLVLAQEPKSIVHANEQPGVIPMAFRVCMANILISACSKIPPSAHQLFSMISIPPIKNYAQVAEDSYIRASCLQMLFTSVYHLKSAAAVIEASHDLMRLSLRSLRGRGVPEERINGAKLLAALLANECSLEEIKPHLMDVQVSLMNIAHLDPSAELRALCEKLLNCMSTIN